MKEQGIEKRVCTSENDAERGMDLKAQFPRADEGTGVHERASSMISSPSQ